MKKMMILVMMMTIAISASAMTYRKARYEALFLTDKMAYELGLNATQLESVYEINLDYLLSVNTPSDMYGPWWNRRNTDLRLVLTGWQYDKYMMCNYFYRPISWVNGGWTFNIYSRYTDRNRYYNAQPNVFVTYRGGNNHKNNNNNSNNNHNNGNNHNNNHNGNHNNGSNNSHGTRTFGSHR